METILVIDAGHGGVDSGAVGNGLKEKDITLDLSLNIGKILEEYIKVIYTREKDEYIGLYNRADIANKAKANIFISIHINSFKDSKANGLETLYYPNSVEGMKLASIIQDKLKLVGFTDRGIKPRGDLVVLNQTNMVAVLVEVGFISNKNDMDILDNKEDEIVKLIAEGILEYLEIKPTLEDKPSEWAEEDWIWGIKNKITDGTRPKDKATREEVISMIRRSREVK